MSGDNELPGITANSKPGKRGGVSTKAGYRKTIIFGLLGLIGATLSGFLISFHLAFANWAIGFLWLSTVGAATAFLFDYKRNNGKHWFANFTASGLILAFTVGCCYLAWWNHCRRPPDVSQSTFELLQVVDKKVSPKTIGERFSALFGEHLGVIRGGLKQGSNIFGMLFDEAQLAELKKLNHEAPDYIPEIPPVKFWTGLEGTTTAVEFRLSTNVLRELP